MSTNKAQLWGSFVEEASESEKKITDITESLEIAMSSVPLNEVMPLESETKENLQEKSRIVLESMDPIMLYAISLHKFAAEMTETIQLMVDSHVTILPSEGRTPVIPKPPFIPLIHPPNILNFIPRDHTPFTLGETQTYPELSNAVAKKVLMQCVATMFAHIGYEQSHSSVLAFLTDVLEDFIKKLCVRMKDAREQFELKEFRTCNNFPVYADKVLQDIGLDGFKGLDDYYQNRVVKYVQVLYKRCEELVKHYEKLLEPSNQSIVDESENKEVLEIIDMEV